MKDAQTRTETDSLGELQVPVNALYAAQTQRAVDNFPISGLQLPAAFIQAVARIKRSAARINAELGLLDAARAEAIVQAASEIVDGQHADQFPVDVFQTGSGTSTNMNLNEVIATLASRYSGLVVNPNDHVNLGQSSNDTIPTAIHLSAALACHRTLLPALAHLSATLKRRAVDYAGVVKTGRTHLMDAMPMTLGQELSGWAWQIDNGLERIQAALPRVYRLAQGGTAVGTGINAHPELAERITALLAAETGLPFVVNPCFFEGLASQDASVELSGQLKTVAVSLMKIANDLRWMNSGPLAGLGEIELPALQPGSSIMPGKVNPTQPEAVLMLCYQVMGNDVTIGMAAASGNFELNVAKPVLAHALLQSLRLLADGMHSLDLHCVRGMAANEKKIANDLQQSLMLVTALAPHIGYDKAAQIAKFAYAHALGLREAALQLGFVRAEDFDRWVRPAAMLGPDAGSPG